MLGGVLVESVGFPRLMLIMGVINLLFCPLILILRPDDNPTEESEKTSLTLFSSWRLGYERFDNAEDEERCKR